MLEIQQKIIDTLTTFRVDVTPGDITRGPTITRYEVYPARGVRVNTFDQYAKDIALATKAESVNIVAPIPGKDTVGIEIVNRKKVAVPLRELLQDPAFCSPKKKIPLALGKDVYGRTVIGDLASMPHLLVAGATGSGKSVCINSIISSMLLKFRPDELRLILVDPKVVEMQPYSKLPHLIVPVVTDPKKVPNALRWCVNEMEHRYHCFAKVGVRNFEAFNKRPPDVPAQETEEPEDGQVDESLAESIARDLESQGEWPVEEDDELDLEDDGVIPERFPYIVIIIDELADLMQTVGADIETNIGRLTQKARAAGIHLIVATQTPRRQVVTGTIKANIPTRIAFQVASGTDSSPFPARPSKRHHALMTRIQYFFLLQPESAPPGSEPGSGRTEGSPSSSITVMEGIKEARGLQSPPGTFRTKVRLDRRPRLRARSKSTRSTGPLEEPSIA